MLRHFARLPNMQGVFLDTLEQEVDGLTEERLGELCKEFDGAVDHWFTALETKVLGIKISTYHQDSGGYTVTWSNKEQFLSDHWLQFQDAYKNVLSVVSNIFRSNGKRRKIRESVGRNARRRFLNAIRTNI